MKISILIHLYFQNVSGSNCQWGVRRIRTLQHEHGVGVKLDQWNQGYEIRII